MGYVLDMCLDGVFKFRHKMHSSKDYHKLYVLQVSWAWHCL